jgi:hypothetical protein
MNAFVEDKASSRKSYHPIGRSLLISSLGVAVLSLAVAFAGVQALVYEPARQAVAQAELGKKARLVELSLSALFKRVDTIARLRRDWGALGMLSTGDEAGIVRLLGTELTHEPAFSSVAMAEDTGREVLLRTSSAGVFVTRQTDPDVHPGTEIDTTWTQDGRPLQRVVRASDYDARRRPWFMQERDAPADAGVTWTAPFVFRSTGLPGMSAVGQWKSPDGRRTISTTDITLTDISRFTRGIEVGSHGFAVVVTGDGAIVGLPGGDASTMLPRAACCCSPSARCTSPLWTRPSRTGAPAPPSTTASCASHPAVNRGWHRFPGSPSTAARPCTLASWHRSPISPSSAQNSGRH